MDGEGLWTLRVTAMLTRRTLLQHSVVAPFAAVLRTQNTSDTRPTTKVKACLNGQRTRADNPGIPITPDEVAASAREAVAGGAFAVHFHVRDREGRPTLDPEDMTQTINAVRAAIPGITVGVSTGAFIERDVNVRYNTIERWRVLPDFASVNMREDGAAALAELLISKGVGIEAGLMDVAGTRELVTKGLMPRCLRILLEPGQPTLEAALDNVKAMEEVLGPLTASRVPRLLHGTGATAWPVLREAIVRGYDTRIGFEDTSTLPNGTTAPGNGALVAAAIGEIRLSQSANR
jgi:uncharacterized protein (DUF849 family)